MYLELLDKKKPKNNKKPTKKNKKNMTMSKKKVQKTRIERMLDLHD